MARKNKSIKQKGLQNVVQTVKVVVGEKRKRSKARRRAPRAEPMVETISAKTLAPVFIQPPVASQQNPYDFQELGKAVGEVAFRTLYDKLPMAKPISKKVDVPEVIQSSKSIAEPFVNGDVLDTDKIITPVPPSASENPTTSVDSTYKVAEAYGFVSDKQPTGDVAVNSPFKQGMGMSVGVSSQDVPNNFDEPAFFPTQSMPISKSVSGLKPPEAQAKSKRTRIGERQKLIPIYRDLFGKEPSKNLTANGIRLVINRARAGKELAKLRDTQDTPPPIPETVTSTTTTNIV